MCDEVMAFQSNSKGDLFTASYLDVRYPHSVDHKVHQALASSAYDELAKQQMQPGNPMAIAMMMMQRRLERSRTPIVTEVHFGLTVTTTTQCINTTVSQ